MASLDLIIEQISSEIFVNADGVGTASIRGTARLADVTMQTLSRHFKGDSKTTNKIAKILAPYGFNPDNFSKTGVPDSAVALIVKYYAWMAGERCTEQAKQVDMVFGAIGARTWMQQVKGWTPAQRTARLLLEDMMSREPLPLESHFSKDWVKNAERLTGWKWEYRVMGKFLKQHVYDLMPPEIRDFLNEVNPMDNEGRRANYNYQHFKDVAAPALKTHIATVLDLMRASSSLPQFEALMKARFTGVYQLRLESVLIEPSAA
jgi:hypothetical protein